MKLPESVLPVDYNKIRAKSIYDLLTFEFHDHNLSSLTLNLSRRPWVPGAVRLLDYS
jgi:hypothetical protein